MNDLMIALLALIGAFLLADIVSGWIAEWMVELITGVKREDEGKKGE